MATDMFVTEVSHQDQNAVYGPRLDDQIYDLSQTFSPMSNDTSMASTTLGTPSYDKTEVASISLSYQYDEAMGEDSPYPEVRAAVSNLDDPTMPANTFRMWILGLLFTIIIAGLNQFFSLRYPSVTITALIAQLLALPCGKVMELVLPTTEFKILGCKFSLNPGPFNIKEHVLITVMANVVWGRAYATEVVAAQWKIYGQSWGFGYQMLLVLSTQLLGFSFGGLLRRFLVWPASMIWPQTLVYAALFNTLHSTYGGFDDGRLSRERFFSYVLVASFLWYWVPGYLFTALSTFNFICWAAPNNVVVNQLFGYTSGLGINIITFDWSMIAYIGSPLVTPWWAEVNVFASLLVIFWILCPVLYYSNVFYGAYLPISGNDAFDKFAHIYNSTIIMSPSGTFNRTAYDHYSPIYIPMTFALSYGMSFAALTATLVHTWLWHREEIMQQFQSSLDKEPDVHARLMLAYPEVPQWYYLTIGAVSFALGVVAITVWDTQLPIWAFIVAIFVALFYAVPIGMVEAITNVQVGLNVFTELIIGYALPGKPVAMMIFKTFGYITMTQALSFTSDLKLGHYMKIPPRLMFTVQTIATIVAAFVSVLVQDWCLANIADICDPQQSDKFTCPHIKVFGVASLIFGSVGPQRTFSHGAIYYPLLYFFVIGAFIPILFYYLSWKYPESWYKYFNAPVFFTGTGAMPPASGINFSSWALVGFIFQYWIRRRHFRWWSSYNYILSAALDSGVAIGVVVIFFSLSLAKGGLTLNWVGNTINDNTADARGAPFKTLSPGRSFGP